MTAAAFARRTPTPIGVPWVVVGTIGAAALAGLLAAFTTPWLALVAGLVIAPLLAVTVRPEAAVLIVSAIVPAASGIRRGLPVPGLRISEVLAIALLGTVVVAAWDGWRPRWSVLDWATLAYTVATVVFVSLGSAVSTSAPDPGTIPSLLLPAQFILLTRGATLALTTRHLRRLALRCVLFASVPVSLLVVLQYLAVGPIRPWITDLTASSSLSDAVALGFEVRATGPFDHWHVLAGYLLPVILLAVSLLLSGDESVVRRPTLLVCAALAMIATGLTFTFTAFAGLAIGVAAISLKVGRFRELLRIATLGSIVLMVLIGPAIAERVDEQFSAESGRDRAAFVPETIDYRFDIWGDQYLPAILDRPIVGYGVELPETITWVYSESLYLSLQLQGGLPLLIVYLALVWAFLAAMAAPTRDPDVTVSAPARAVTATTVALVPMHAIFPYLSSPGLPHVLWLLAGIALASRWRTEAPGRADDSSATATGTLAPNPSDPNPATSNR